MSIDQNIPMPEKRRGARPKYPWRTMEVGDSFIIDQPIGGARSQASMAGRNYGRKFKVRELEGGIVRVWRTV